MPSSDPMDTPDPTVPDNTLATFKNITEAPSPDLGQRCCTSDKPAAHTPTKSTYKETALAVTSPQPITRFFHAATAPLDHPPVPPVAFPLKPPNDNVLDAPNDTLLTLKYPI